MTAWRALSRGVFAAAIDWLAVGMLFALTPWLVYWVLIGNVPSTAAASVALTVAVAALLVGGFAGNPGRAPAAGAVATFAVLTLLTVTLGDSFLLQWLLPLSNAGILLVTLVGPLVGAPFVAEFAAAEQPPDAVKTGLFGRMAGLLARVWVAAFAGMTVSSVIPPIVDRESSILDAKTPLSVVCYWVVPFSLLAGAALVSRVLPARMLAGIDDVARETSFVAYDEATIDELYYLAQEHANREVGPGKEAYQVKVGGMGTPLTGDESRKSWPSTYKVRDKRR
jgi:tetrahydromethanopterin S-methyltransferase subunit F